MSRMDSQLIRQAREGSSEALDAVLERYGERLLALIRLRLGPGSRRKLESRWVLHQTLLRAFRFIDHFDGSGETSLMGWLGAIVHEQILNGAGGPRGLDDGEASAALYPGIKMLCSEEIRTEVRSIELRDQAQRLERAMDRLSPQHREILLLRRFEELSFLEIGDRMDKPPESCRTLYASATAALALRLHEIDQGA